MRPAPTLALLAAGLLCAGCGLFADPPAAQVSDPDAERLARRLERFYSELEDVPVDAALTWESPYLRGYFADPTAFADFYASLAGQVRDARLRDSRLLRIEVREFRVPSPGLAYVDVALIGVHQRALRFWEIELARTDTWTRVEGTWYLTPDRL